MSHSQGMQQRPQEKTGIRLSKYAYAHVLLVRQVGKGISIQFRVHYVILKFLNKIVSYFEKEKSTIKY